VATVAAGGSLLAAAPFTTTRLGHVAPAVRLWSHDYGPLGVPLLAAGRCDEAAGALLELLAPAGSGRALIVPDLPLDGAAAAALARAAASRGRSVAILARHPRAIAIRRGTGYAAAGALSHHRRHEYARQMRRLGDCGRVTIETAADPQTVRSRFEEFLVLEAAGWKGIGKTALASEPGRAGFARAAVAAAADAGTARIHSIRVDGRAIAALTTLISGRTAFTWKIAYDEGFARASPGAQVMLAAIGSLLAEPLIGRLDSCAGPNHPLADPLLPDRAAMGTLVISPVGEGSRYRAGLAAARLEAAARDSAKRIRDRLQ
jgi:CelD/BcsL family acetyltransferase involved in cellulose biosynthesis